MALKYSVIILFFLWFALISSANGQACGRYYITVSVKTLDGQLIKNAQVDLKAIDKDETQGKNFVRDKDDPSKFSVDYFEGHSFMSFHELTISAPGFNSTENLAKFTSCENRGVIVKLAKAGSPSPAVWSFQNNVNVEAVGTDGQPIEGVTLTVIDSRNKSETEDMKFGFAYFTLPNGEFTFRFDAKGYQTKDEKVDLTKLSRQSVKLELVRQAALRGVLQTNYCMTVRDGEGATIPRATIKLLPTIRSATQTKYVFTANNEELIDVYIIEGVYNIEVMAASFTGAKLKNQFLPYDPRQCVDVNLKSSIAPHQIT